MESERQIVTHHDGHGLNESIIITANEAGPGGASHEYKAFTDGGGGYMRSLAYIQFQKGPRNVEGSIPGITTVALLAILIDHLQGFQSGAFPTKEGACAITHLQEAEHWLRARAWDRANRGVLGQNVK